MDAFLGLYDNGSSDSDDDEWIAQLELGNSLGNNSNQKKNLPPEPQSGNIEYKLKLVNPTEQRIQHLVTQVLHPPPLLRKKKREEKTYYFEITNSNELEGFLSSSKCKSHEMYPTVIITIFVIQIEI